MKKFLFILLFLTAIVPAQAEILPLKNYNSGNYYQEKTLSEMLLYSEKQIFNKTYKKNSLAERLERLELAVYGALQEGTEAQRVQNIHYALTNVSSGGLGLQYVTKSRDLTSNSSAGSFWSFGNTAANAFNYANHLNNNYYKHAHPKSYHRYHNHASHRLPPPCHHHSHRLYPNNNYYRNPIINGDFSNNYSLGTSVKILDD